MIDIAIGTTVTIGLVSGQVLIGKIEKCSTENILLRSSNGIGITIITHPERDIAFIYYEENIKEKLSKDVSILKETDQEFEKILKEPFSEEKPKKLAELKILMSKAEKDIVANQLKNHTIADIKKVNYGIPNIKKPRIK